MATTPTYNFNGGETADNLSGTDSREYTGGGTVLMTTDGWSNSDLGLTLDTGLWKVTINGILTSVHAGRPALDLESSASSTITIGDGAEVYGGGSYGVYVQGAINIVNHGSVIGQGKGISVDAGASAVSIVNSGTIVGEGNGSLASINVMGAGKYTITNSGTLQGDVAADDVLGLSTTAFTNSGTVHGEVTLGGGNNTITNSGVIDNLVFAGVGNDKLANSGEIGGNVSLGEGNNTITNTGILDFVTSLGAGNDTFTNKGTIGYTSLSGSVLSAGAGNDTITNNGSAEGDIYAGAGNDHLTNTGTVYGKVDLGGDQDTANNSGVITGMFDAGSGNDQFTNTGTVFGTIIMGDGDDVFTGGNQVDKVMDGMGHDTYKLGGGNDTFIAIDTTHDAATDDIVDGGANSQNLAQNIYGDTYDASASLYDVLVNLDSVAHVGLGDDATAGLAARMTSGVSIGHDTITGFEVVLGGQGVNHIWGSSAAEFLQGGPSNNYLYGMGGNDKLIGSAGADVLCGGIGADQLIGGGIDNTRDIFLYTSVKDSTVVAGGRDIISGFDTIESNPDHSDVIEFLGMGSFHFGGLNTDFDGQKGDVRVIESGTGWQIQVDTTGDHKADMAIDVDDNSHWITWSASDFIFHA